MDVQTVKKLNQIDKQFYQQTAKHFSQTRQSPWQGWHELLPVIKKIAEKKKEFKVLDLGCGNGRFGLFLNKQLKGEQISYLGIDSSQQLLDLAGKNLRETKLDFKLEKKDLVKILLKKELQFSQQFDLIVAFGLVHHLPGFELRKKFFSLISENLKPTGWGVVTLWQFADHDRFNKKKVSPTKAGLSKNDLEENDFILDWQRGTEAFRYCHFVNQEEESKLINQSNLVLADSFTADGKSNDLNKYLIIKINY